MRVLSLFLLFVLKLDYKGEWGEVEQTLQKH